jgi:hypothetical protein
MGALVSAKRPVRMSKDNLTDLRAMVYNGVLLWGVTFRHNWGKISGV